MAAWKPLDPYRGKEIEPLHGQELIDLVDFYKRTADQNGEPHDPEWDRWLAEDAEGPDDEPDDAPSA
jgi:hypothetical protein